MEKNKKRASVGMQPMQVDQISDLPDTVLHHIFSFLPLEYVAQTCVLSKRWLRVWQTYPILDFSPYSFGLQSIFIPPRDGNDDLRYTEYRKTLDKYTNFIDYKLQNYCNHNLEIQKFNLAVICEPKFYPLIDKWIGLLRDKHVKQLKLSLFISRKKLRYCYLSAQKVFDIKSLTELSIQSLETVCPSAIKHKSLVALSLDQVRFDRMLIFDDQNLPCIRFITLSSCSAPGGLKISCHGLQELKLFLCRKLNEIEVFAPVLSLMSFSSRVTDKPSFFSLSAPPKLLSLKLSSTFARFDSSLLRKIRLFDFRFYSSFSRFDTPWSHNLHTSWFIKMKEFVLQMQNQTKTLDLLFLPSRQLQNTFDRREASRGCDSPPYALKCLSLELRCLMILDYAALMDGLFWSFHPEILSISCFCHGGQDGCLLEFLRKTFEGKEEDDNLGTSKFWWQWSIFKVTDIIVKDSKGIMQTTEIMPKIPAKQCVDFYLNWR